MNCREMMEHATLELDLHDFVGFIRAAIWGRKSRMLRAKTDIKGSISLEGAQTDGSPRERKIISMLDADF